MIIYNNLSEEHKEEIDERISDPDNYKRVTDKEITTVRINVHEGYFCAQCWSPSHVCNCSESN